MIEIRAAEALNLQHRAPPPLAKVMHTNVVEANQAQASITVAGGQSPSPSPSLTRSYKRPGRSTQQ